MTLFVGYYAFLFFSNINDTKRLSYVHTILLKKNLTALPFKKPISPRTSTFLLLYKLISNVNARVQCNMTTLNVMNVLHQY